MKANKQLSSKTVGIRIRTKNTERNQVTIEQVVDHLTERHQNHKPERLFIKKDLSECILKVEDKKIRGKSSWHYVFLIGCEFVFEYYSLEIQQHNRKSFFEPLWNKVLKDSENYVCWSSDAYKSKNTLFEKLETMETETERIIAMKEEFGSQSFANKPIDKFLKNLKLLDKANEEIMENTRNQQQKEDEFEYKFPQHLLARLPEGTKHELYQWFLQECTGYQPKPRGKALVLFSKGRGLGKTEFARSLLGNVHENLMNEVQILKVLDERMKNTRDRKETEDLKQEIAEHLRKRSEFENEIQSLIIHIRGIATAKCNFDNIETAKLLLLDDYHWNHQVTEEIKAFVVRQGTNVRGCGFSLFFPHGLPTIITTNKEAIFASMKETPVFQTSCVFITVEDYLGPPGTEDKDLINDMQGKIREGVVSTVTRHSKPKTNSKKEYEDGNVNNNQQHHQNYNYEKENETIITQPMTKPDHFDMELATTQRKKQRTTLSQEEEEKEKRNILKIPFNPCFSKNF